MKLNKAERMLKALDKKVKGKLQDEPRGSVYLSIQAKMADQRAQDAAKQVKKEGII